MSSLENVSGDETTDATEAFISVLLSKKKFYNEMISGLQVLKVLLFGWKNNLIKADLLNVFMVSF